MKRNHLAAPRGVMNEGHNPSPGPSPHGRGDGVATVVQASLLPRGEGQDEGNLLHILVHAALGYSCPGFAVAGRDPSMTQQPKWTPGGARRNSRRMAICAADSRLLQICRAGRSARAKGRGEEAAGGDAWRCPPAARSASRPLRAVRRPRRRR